MQILSTTLKIALILVFLDVAILFAGLGEIAQGHGGYWSPFWRAQADFVIHMTHI